MNVNLGLFQSVTGYNFGRKGASGFLVYGTYRITSDGYFPGMEIYGSQRFPLYIKGTGDAGYLPVGGTYEYSNTKPYVDGLWGIDSLNGNGIVYFDSQLFYPDSLQEQPHVREAFPSEFIKVHAFYGPNPHGGECNLCWGFIYAGAVYSLYQTVQATTTPRLNFYFDHQLDKLKHNGTYVANNDYYWELKCQSGLTIDVEALALYGWHDASLTRRAVRFYKTNDDGSGWLTHEQYSAMALGQDAVLTKKPKPPGKTFVWRSA